MTARRALLCDYAGVLTADMAAIMSAFCTREGIPSGRLMEAYLPGGDLHGAAAEYECGRLSADEFAPVFAGALGIERHEGVLDRVFEDVPLAHDVVAAIARVRASGARTVLFSNSWGLEIYDPEVRAAFDAEVVSEVVGCRKPEPEIYPLAVEAAGVAPEECVFVDDQERNLAPARELGIHVVHHTDPAATIAALDELFTQERSRT